MRAKATTANQSVSPIKPVNGVVTLWGYNSRVALGHGDLLVSDGICDERRQGRISRIAKLRRLVVIGDSGTINLAALRFCHDTGAVFVNLGRDGEIITVSNPPGKDDARLRRAQALAAGSEVGLALARELIRRKVEGQQSVLARLGIDDMLARNLSAASNITTLRSIEADAAARYWQAWRDVPICWVSKDTKTVPDHWRTFGTRSSPLTNSPRLAANPANAVLNYAYALLEVEARIALLTLGLDPGLGVMHADQPGRSNFALDIMESARPAVDVWVLELLRSHRFSKREVCQLPDGTCRLLPEMAKQVAATLPRWRQAIAPVAEWVASALIGGPVATHLTQDNRSAGRDGIRTGVRKQAVPDVGFPNACRMCGVLLSNPERQYCDECLPDVLTDHAATWNETARAKLAAMRTVGNDPAHAASANRQRGQKNAAHVAAAQVWQPDGTSVDFARDIMPGLQGVSLATMAQATGLSQGYCSFIRRGLKVPHPRHWEALAKLGTALRSVTSAQG